MRVQRGQGAVGIYVVSDLVQKRLFFFLGRSKGFEFREQEVEFQVVITCWGGFLVIWSRQGVRRVFSRFQRGSSVNVGRREQLRLSIFTFFVFLILYGCVMYVYNVVYVFGIEEGFGLCFIYIVVMFLQSDNCC